MLTASKLIAAGRGPGAGASCAAPTTDRTRLGHAAEEPFRRASIRRAARLGVFLPRGQHRAWRRCARSPKMAPSIAVKCETGSSRCSTVTAEASAVHAARPAAGRLPPRQPARAARGEGPDLPAVRARPRPRRDAAPAWVCWSSRHKRALRAGVVAPTTRRPQCMDTAETMHTPTMRRTTTRGTITRHGHDHGHVHDEHCGHDHRCSATMAATTTAATITRVALITATNPHEHASPSRRAGRVGWHRWRCCS